MRFDLKSFQFVDTDVAPDALAVAAADRSLTWAQLRAEAAAWADAARKNGAGPDVPVAIYGHKEASFFVAMVGALLIDPVRGFEGTIWRISAAPRRKQPKKA